MKTNIRYILLVLTLQFVGRGALAQSQAYAIDWHSIDGGGGASTGALYSVSGTVGQPDAGKMSSATYRIDGGFWGIIAVVPAPGAPLLSIQLTNSGVILSWPAPSTGFVLQENPAAGTGTWTAVTNGVNVVGGQNQVLVSPAIENKFYRLKK